MTAGMVRTVLGDVAPEALGKTMMHEHLLIGFGRWRREAADMERARLPEGESAEPITLANRHRIALYSRHPDQYVLDNEGIATAEAQRYADAGGGTIVDVTNPDLTRQPEALAKISRATGLNVVMGCGRYVGSNHPLDMDDRSVEALADEMVADVLSGADGTDVRAGIIGEIGTEYPVTQNEGKALEAAAIAGMRTGAAVSIHPGRDARAPLACMEVINKTGFEPSRTIMGHLDRTLFLMDDFLLLAETGCYLEFDLFGQESSYYAHAPIDMPNDAMRINLIMGLFEAGFGDRVVVSQDICQKTNLATWGGHGYSHILENVVPVMLRKGMREEDIERILVENPARILVLEEPLA